MKIKYFIPSIVWTLIVVVVLSLPGSVFPKIPNFLEWLTWDKLVHFTIFGLLSFLLMWGFFQNRGVVKRGDLCISAVIGIMLGGLTELMQYYWIINRSGNWFDFIANILGVLLGCVVFIILVRHKIVLLMRR